MEAIGRSAEFRVAKGGTFVLCQGHGREDGERRSGPSSDTLGPHVEHPLPI